MTDGSRPSPPASWRRRIVTIAWGVAVWCALWGDLSVANVLWGAVAMTAVLLLLPATSIAGDDRGALRPVATARFALWFAWALVRSSAVVAWEIVTPGNDITEGIVAVPLATSSPGIVTLIANTISLTPGTLTLEVRMDPPTLYVHVLHLHDLDEVHGELAHLQRLACATVGIEPASQADDADEPHDRESGAHR